MVERLKKCMTTNEKYFCKLVLIGKNKTLDIRVNALARELRLSPGTIHDALRILEVAGYVRTQKSYKCTVVKIINQQKIKQVVEDE